MQSIATILNKYAKRDLNAAKKHGQLAICGTKKGNVEIQSLSNNLFQAVNFNNGNIKLTEVIPAKEMIDFIAGIYIVE